MYHQRNSCGIGNEIVGGHLIKLKMRNIFSNQRHGSPDPASKTGHYKTNLTWRQNNYLHLIKSPEIRLQIVTKNKIILNFERCLLNFQLKLKQCRQNKRRI